MFPRPAEMGKRRRYPNRAALAGRLLCTLAAAAPMFPGFASAGWREDMAVFRIGMIVRPGSDQAVPGLSIIQRAFAQALGVPAKVFVARDFPALIDAQASGRVDYAIYSATAYATAARLCGCVEPVVAPVGDDGATGVVAVLITRDHRVADVTSLTGHRIGLSPTDSVAGYMLPRAELAAAGVDLAKAAPSIVEASDASAAEAMLVDGSVDAIFGWLPALPDGDASGGTIERLTAAGLDRRSLDVVWRSAPLPYGPHALRVGLDPELRQALVTFLTGLKGWQPDVYDLIEADHGGGFIEVHSGDYEGAVAMVAAAAK